jgi:hypothetical protein
MKAILTILWVIGVILAEGFWWKVLAFFFPFYAWYVGIEHIIIKYSLL